VVSDLSYLPGPAYCVFQIHYVCDVHNSLLILIAFITGNSSLEPLIVGLCAQIHVNLR